MFTEGEKSPFFSNMPILDATYNTGFGDFTVKGIDNADGSHVSRADPVLMVSGGT
jgi:hypothetical protein